MTAPITVAWHVPVRHRDRDRMPASVWIRCLQLLPYLERHGVRSVVNDTRTAADVAVFVRWQDARALAAARAARRAGARVVVDLCVNYLDETGLMPGGYGVLARHVDECRAMLDGADAVTAASAFIAGRARQAGARVAYLPDSVDAAHFALRKRHGPGAPPVAIWCGVSVKAAELEPVLPRLDKRGIPLVIVSDARPSLSIPFEFVRWRHAGAPRDLLRGDVCIAPRDVDNAYNRGHSFFRIGVFLAQGVPVLAGPVPSYAEVLRPGDNGLVCATGDEWEAALDALQDDRGRLARWSGAAVAAMAPYSTEALAARYAAVFRALCEGRPLPEGGA
jgi:glycosyltransferase involved in cell wall biosynthesis